MRKIAIVATMFICQGALSMLRPAEQDRKSSTLPMTMSNAHYDEVVRQSAKLSVDVDEISPSTLQMLQNLQNGNLSEGGEFTLMRQCSDCLSVFDIAYLNPYHIKRIQTCISIIDQTSGMASLRALRSCGTTDRELDQAVTISEIIKNCTNMPNRQQFLYFYMTGAKV
ncbi:MAG: hypothetical protein LBL30_00270 [Holosporales bacterium]|jgi:hypothetical protein|nr:hypothetical protein [Holosporales bacterium]